MNKISDKLISVLCDPEGNVCINGSNEDRRLLQECISEVKDLEKEVVWTQVKNI